MSRRSSLKALLVLILSAACFFGGIRVERERQRREDEAAALAARNAEREAALASRRRLTSAFGALRLQAQQLVADEERATAAVAIAQSSLDRKLAEIEILRREIAEAQQEREDALKIYRKVEDALKAAYRETEEEPWAQELYGSPRSEPKRTTPKRRLIESTLDKVDSPQSLANPSA